MADLGVIRRQQQEYTREAVNYNSAADAFNAGPRTSAFTGVEPAAAPPISAVDQAALNGTVQPAQLEADAASAMSPMAGRDRDRQIREKGILARMLSGDLRTKSSEANPTLGLSL